MDEENAGQYYPDFAFSHLLFSEKMHIYSDSTVSRFLSSVSQEKILRFLDDWNRQIIEAYRKSSKSLDELMIFLSE